MTADHLTPAQTAVSGFFPDDVDAKGWGFCVGALTGGPPFDVRMPPSKTEHLLIDGPSRA